MINTRKHLERQLNQLLFLRHEILEDILSTQLHYIELEKHFKGTYIDLYAIHGKKKVPVFIEVQKDEMDLAHFIQVIDLIEKIDEGVIVWVTTKTSQRFIEKLAELIEKQEKFLEILIIEVQPDIVLQLNILKQMEPKKRVHLIMSSEYNIPEFHLKKKLTSNRVQKHSLIPQQQFEGNVKTNQELLSILRHTYPYFGNVLRSKSNLHRRQFQMGSGTGYIEIVLSAIPMGMKVASLELRSTNYTTIPVLEQMQEKLKEVQFSSPVTFEERCFIVNYGTTLSKDQIFKRMVHDFGKLIDVLEKFHNK